MEATRFYLGTNSPSWLKQTEVPLFVSYPRIAREVWSKGLPRARGPWALDSGAFSEVSRFGEFKTDPKTYARAVKRYAWEIGNLDWVAPQDWMTEPFVREKTGLSVVESQERTIDSYVTLKSLGIPVIPVLQGWEDGEHEDHVYRYAERGIDLRDEDLVGVGSVCRRSSTDETTRIIRRLAGLDVSLHGFGVKTLGLERYGGMVTSADSMAWSFRARMRRIKLPECTHRGKTCVSCLRYALMWREGVLAKLL